MAPRTFSLIKPAKIRQIKSSFSPFLFTIWLIRIGILSASLSAIASTILTTFKPINIPLISSAEVTKETVKSEVLSQNKSVSLDPQASNGDQKQLPLKQELLPLRDRILLLAKASPKLKPYALFLDLDNGNYVDIDSTKAISAASTIKTFVLYAFFQDVDSGKIRLDENLTMDQADIAGGSGDMQYQKPNTKFTALETATKMIVISDNTATNMLIKRLGGQDVLNRRINSWAMSSTYLKSPLPDLKGTNKTTARDLGRLLYRINEGDLLSIKSRDRIIKILSETKIRTLLPQGLADNSEIAHKTGDIGTILGDAGIVNMPNGKRYIAVAFVERPYNDVAGKTMIQEISKIMDQGFKNPPPAKTTATGQLSVKINKN